MLTPRAGCCQWAENNSVVRGVGCFRGEQCRGGALLMRAKVSSRWGSMLVV